MHYKLFPSELIIIISFLIIVVQQPATAQDTANSEEQQDFWTENLQTILLAIVGVLGVLGTVISPYVNSKLNHKLELEKNLQNKRIEQYGTLWKDIGHFMRSTNVKVTYRELDDLSKRLTQWYYGASGILLTHKGLDSFQRLQNQIHIMQNRNNTGLTGPLRSNVITADEYKQLIKLIRKLRDSLQQELGMDLNISIS